MKNDTLPTENILGYDITTVPRKEFTKSICKDYKNFKNVCVFTINPHSYITSLHDKKFKSSLNNAEFLVPDGTGFVLASIVLGGQISKRITGNDLFMEISGHLNHDKAKYAFFGSRQNTLNIITDKMKKEFPNIEIVCTISPPFRNITEEENLNYCKEINNSGAEVLWVGMTAPKQEKWIYDNLHQLNVKIILPVGAVFDFYAGTVKRPSAIWCKLGLEWLPRFAKHPIRLWRRNFISSPLFLLILACAKIRQILKKNNSEKIKPDELSTNTKPESKKVNQIN